MQLCTYRLLLLQRLGPRSCGEGLLRAYSSSGGTRGARSSSSSGGVRGARSGGIGGARSSPSSLGSSRSGGGARSSGAGGKRIGSSTRSNGSARSGGSARATSSARSGPRSGGGTHYSSDTRSNSSGESRVSRGELRVSRGSSGGDGGPQRERRSRYEARPEPRPSPSRLADATGGPAPARAVRRRVPPPLRAPSPPPSAPEHGEATLPPPRTPLRPSPVGFPLWTPGRSGARRYAWPLFGLDCVPRATPVQASLAARVFGAGGVYLGDEGKLCAPAADGAPATHPWVELAVMGRSNVGKSTLLNALLGSPHGERARAFVPVSRVPGTTTRLDFYACGVARPPALVLVDTPGYGYVARGRASHDAWMARLSGYLRTRRAAAGGAGTLLARVAVLIDARLGITELDEGVLRALEDAALPCHVVLTKADALREPELEAVALRTARALGTLRMPFPVLNAVSAETGAGMPELHEALMQVTKLHRLDPALAQLHMQQASKARRKEERDGLLLERAAPNYVLEQS